MPNDSVCLSRVVADDLIDVETIFDDLRNYSERVDGGHRRKGAALEFATAFPPSSHIQNKHAFVAYRHGLPVGLLDIIDAYPVPGTAFIGLLAVRESLHGAGLGRILYAQAEQFIQRDLRAKTVRIAVVETNRVSGFWQQMGFTPTGEVKRYEGEAVSSQAILMEKTLPSAV